MNMNVVRNNSSKRMNIINMHAYDKLVAFSDSSTANGNDVWHMIFKTILIII